MFIFFWRLSTDRIALVMFTEFYLILARGGGGTDHKQPFDA